MKKISLFIRNLYRVTIARPSGTKAGRFTVEDDLTSDAFIRSIVKSDPSPEPDEEIYEFLAARVSKKRNPVAENSLSQFLVPFFSIKHIELKMAVISLIFVISLGIKQPSQYQVNRTISPFSLADTLIDSSKLKFPDNSITNPQR